MVRQSRKETAPVRAEYHEEFGKRPRRITGWLVSVALVAVGLAMLVVGARWLVNGAVAAATALCVSELVLGLGRLPLM